MSGKEHRLDRRNVSLGCFQIAYDVSSLTAALVRFEECQSPVWQASAQHDIAKIRAALDEVETVLVGAPRVRRPRVL